jgi:Flp pilus assembly secretin CpaC
VKKLLLVVAVALSSIPTLSQAEDAPAPARPRVVALRVQAVLSRAQGEHKTVSRPYTFTLATNNKFTLRQGTEVPIPVTTFEKDGKDATSFQYKNVGANIELTADALDGERFLLGYAFEDSSLFYGQGSQAASAIKLREGVPAFDVMSLKGQLVLRDGQTATSTTTHPVTGEVTKLELTLSLLK